MRRYCLVLTARIAGEPPAFRGKPRFCKKDTVKRRRDKERLFAMMKFANLKEQSNGEPWRSRITLLLKPSDALPSRLRSLQTFVDTSWLGTTTIRTLYPARATFAILHRYLRYQLKGFQLTLRIVAGRQLVQGMRGGDP